MHSRPTSRLALAASFLLSAPAAFAYPYVSSQPSISSNPLVSGIQTRTSGTDTIYNIPITNWPEQIVISARGGDGGRAKAEAAIGSDKTAQGGGGAQLNATFAIHPTNASALRPGGELRFVVGSRGYSQSEINIASGGGGGGTAVLYRAAGSVPNNRHWRGNWGQGNWDQCVNLDRIHSCSMASVLKFEYPAASPFRFSGGRMEATGSPLRVRTSGEWMPWMAKAHVRPDAESAL